MGQIITVGSGKDYDTANGIVNLVNDFSTLAGAGVVEVEIYPDYDYLTGITLAKDGVDASNYFLFRPSPEHKHPMDFVNSVKLKAVYVGGAWGGAMAFWLKQGFHKFHNLRFYYDQADGIAGGVFFTDYLAPVNSSETEFFGCLFEQYTATGSKYAQPFNFQKASKWYIRNCVSHSTTVTGSVYSHLSIANAGAVAEMYNNCFYNSNAINFLGSSSKLYNNAFVYQTDNTVGSFLNSSNCVGSNNSDNYAAGGLTIGTEYNRTTLANMAFVDIPNRNFSLKANSNLINSGVYKIENPTNISGVPWLNYHRHPNENVVLVDLAEPYPKDCSKLYGVFENECLLAIPYNNSVYDIHNSFNTEFVYAGTNESTYESSIYGETRKFNSTLSYDEYNCDLTAKKKLSFFFTFKKIQNAISGDRWLLKDSTESSIEVIFNNVTEVLTFKLGTWYGYVDLTSYVDMSKWINIIILLDLDESTDANRLKILISCCGGSDLVTSTFSGTAPSQIGTASLLRFGDAPGEYANTMIYDYCIDEWMIDSLTDDPYLPYRDPFKIHEMVAAGYIKGADGIWRHQSKLFGPSTTMAGTSTMMV